MNVGAGTGSYEPIGCDVVAVEPSAAMIGARMPGAAPAIHGTAESLPFADGGFDTAMAILSVHHWADQVQGLAELRRVARRQVVLTWDPVFAEAFWLTADSLPQIADLNRSVFRPICDVVGALGGGELQVVEVPHDCTDGFLCAYWRRPEAFLDPRIRAGISSFALIEPSAISAGLDRLRSDLRNGAFWNTHADLAARNSLDLGYRLVVAGR